MYTKRDLMDHFHTIGIKPEGTLLVHSSMKSIGEVQNRADTVIDAFIDYMKPGLLVFPTHTWAQMSREYTMFDPQIEPSCIGILTNLFMKRPGVIRSWHPTHSVAALGNDAADFVADDHLSNTPCARKGCWGKLYDRGAQILFVGCGFATNTIIHGVEEWNNVPRRLTKELFPFTIKTPEGMIINCPMHRHFCSEGDVSDHYKKLEKPMLATGISRKGLIGDAESILVDVIRMVDLTSLFLKRDPNLFINDDPVPESWYRDWE